MQVRHLQRVEPPSIMKDVAKRVGTDTLRRVREGVRGKREWEREQGGGQREVKLD